MKLQILAFVFSAALIVGVASAASEASAQEGEATTSYAKETVIDFNDVTLEGELTKPEGSYLLDRKKTKFSSLISLRTEFLSELQTSVDNL